MFDYKRNNIECKTLNRRIYVEVQHLAGELFASLQIGRLFRYTISNDIVSKHIFASQGFSVPYLPFTDGPFVNQIVQDHFIGSKQLHLHPIKYLSQKSYV